MRVTENVVHALSEKEGGRNLLSFTWYILSANLLGTKDWSSCYRWKVNMTYEVPDIM